MLQKANKHIGGNIAVVIEAFRPDNRVRDLDNLLKASLDGLVHSGVFIDDSQIQDLRIFWAKDKGGKLLINVERI
jgi:crossover junction endodeoxyribonuclease RusA